MGRGERRKEEWERSMRGEEDKKQQEKKREVKRREDRSRDC